MIQTNQSAGSCSFQGRIIVHRYGSCFSSNSIAHEIRCGFRTLQSPKLLAKNLSRTVNWGNLGQQNEKRVVKSNLQLSGYQQTYADLSGTQQVLKTTPQRIAL